MVQTYSILDNNELQYLCQEIYFEPYQIMENRPEIKKSNKILTKNMQNLVIFMEPSEHAHEVSLKSEKMYLNRFCIDEDAAFESSGVLLFLDYWVNMIHVNSSFLDSIFHKIIKSKTEDMETHLGGLSN